MRGRSLLMYDAVIAVVLEAGSLMLAVMAKPCLDQRKIYQE